MPTEYPLLKLPDYVRSTRPKGHGGGAMPKLPTRERQSERLGPQFRRLESVLQAANNDDTAILSLRNDPSSIAPERAIVFEVAGELSDFYQAVQQVPGLEYLGEDEMQFDPDQDFSVIDTRKATKGQPRLDKSVGGRLYLAMPDLAALRELLRGWEVWVQHGRAPFNSAQWRNLFNQLRAIRPWGAQDRISNEVVTYWREMLAGNPGRSVRTEIELWFHNSADARDRAFSRFQTVVTAFGGEVVHSSVIAEISYHAALIDIPARHVEQLLAQNQVSLALADEVMYVRPQAITSHPSQIEASEDTTTTARAGASQLPPIAALFDGVPIQQHSLLVDRLVVDDPDDFQSHSPVVRRVHGTAMASLILHGDLNTTEQPLRHKLYVRPLMYGSDDGNERTHDDHLLVDTIYRAVKRIKEGDEEGNAVAPQVFVINLSMGDPRRPFAGPISPWGKLLDFLSHKYGVLFVVSAGNVKMPLELRNVADWTSFERMSSDQREKEVLNALNASKASRTLLSPAESLNSLTVGALHADHVPAPRTMPVMSLDPYTDSSLPSLISALGLGHRRVVKPDIFMPGGRAPVMMQGTANGHLSVVPVVEPGRHYGLKAATSDRSGRGRLNYTALTAGTSAAAALTTRAAHQLYDALTLAGGPLDATLDPEYFAVLIKTLIAHNAKWGGKAPLLEELFGPHGPGKHSERRENVARFLGLGRPTIADVCECAMNRATLVGYGKIAASPDISNNYSIPIPACLTGVTVPRHLIMTLAWFSPVNTRHQAYRSAKLEIAPGNEVSLDEIFGVARVSNQPTDKCVGKGTIIHYRYSGEKVVPFVDQGQVLLKIWCRDSAGPLDGEIIYGFAVTIGAETMIPVYEQIRNRLRAPITVAP